MDTIKKNLLASYRSLGGINHLDGSNLPSREGVDSLVSDFMHLLFPGFFESGTITKEEFDGSLDDCLGNLQQNLTREINKSFACMKEKIEKGAAEEETLHVLKHLPLIRQILLTDVHAAYIGDPAARSYEEIILAYPCVTAIALYRIAHILYEREVPLLPRMLTEHAHRLTGIDIHPGATIGSHFFIDHGTGVVIGETTTIGSHVKLYQGVTLGARSFKVDESGKIIKGTKRHPDIEDHVTIYSGATILGGDTRVGANSIVGANVWLMESIPPHSLAYYKGTNLQIRTRSRDDRVEENESSQE